MRATKNVLICEDDPVQLRIMSAALKQAGYGALPARSPMEAVRQVRRGGADALVMDVQLQQGSAFDVLAEVRKLGCDAPALMVSGYTTPFMKNQARSSGVRALLDKPYDVGRVLSFVAGAVREKPAPRALGRVVVVEDHPQIRGLVETALGEEGFEVRAAADGDRALELLRSLRADVALVDMHVPGRSGADLVGEIRRSDPGIYVVLMTGEADSDELRAAYAAGADTLIRKPFTPSRLAGLLKGSLPAARARRVEQDRIEREERARAAKPWGRRVLARIGGFARKTRVQAAAMVAAAAILAGIAGAFCLDLAPPAWPVAAALSDPATLSRPSESPFQRWVQTEQLRIGREATDSARRYYEGHLEALRLQQLLPPAIEGGLRAR